MSETPPADDLQAMVECYREAAQAHGRALLEGDHGLANRSHDIVAAIYRELRGRGLQSVVIRLLRDPDRSVRLWAAAHTLELNADLAVPVLTALAEGQDVISFEAAVTLRQWRKGELRFP